MFLVGDDGLLHLAAMRGPNADRIERTRKIFPVPLEGTATEQAIRGMDQLAEGERKRLEYFSRQILDMMAPTNFLGTNPDALEKAVETNGESLVKGLENLVRDIEANKGDLLVTLADKDAFKVGQNIGTTAGTVVFRNRLIELPP